MAEDSGGLLTIKIDRRQLLNPQLLKLSEISAGIVSGFSRGFQQVQRFKLEGVTAKFIPVLLKFAIFVAPSCNPDRCRFSIAGMLTLVPLRILPDYVFRTMYHPLSREF